MPQKFLLHLLICFIVALYDTLKHADTALTQSSMSFTHTTDRRTHQFCPFLGNHVRKSTNAQWSNVYTVRDCTEAATPVFFWNLSEMFKHRTLHVRYGTASLSSHVKMMSYL